MAFSSQDLIESRMDGEEDEEEPQCDIMFFEGIDFLGAIDRKLDRERKEKNTTVHDNA